MEIFVASTSAHKLRAVQDAARVAYPRDEIHVSGFKASSNINEQPVGHEQTLEGALNRLAHLKQLVGQTRCDILVAMENGIFSVNVDGQPAWFDVGWVIAEDAQGNRGIAHSTGVEFPEADVVAAQEKGFETTTVGSIIAGRTGADSTDPHAYLTKGVVARADMLAQCLQTALGQLLRKTQEESHG